MLNQNQFNITDMAREIIPVCNLIFGSIRTSLLTRHSRCRPDSEDG